ncbi:MAG: hypothetical protein HBSAPP03_12700 [Phycisphaerae bacterium]|nr:MAG: hypothetical protein HBSAPP03_12700 [Phycisphaerae bacterium]
MNRNDLLAEGVEQSRTLLARFYPGFSDANHTTQAPGLPNHLAWCLGHLALTMHRVAGMLDGGPIPPDAFLEGADRGDARRFGVESVSFASAPTDDPTRYPGFARCVEVFDAATARLASALRSASPDALDQPVTWGKTTSTPGAMAFRMVFHNGVHCGQITDLRRALKMGTVLA